MRKKTEIQDRKVKEVKITNPMEKEIKNGYYITVNFMYGDADGFVDREIGPFTEDEMDLLYDAIETLERCVHAYPNGRCGDDTYDHIKGFSKWFGFEYDDEDEIPEQAIEMEYEPDGWGGQASFEYYTVNYYKNGDPFECEIEWED